MATLVTSQAKSTPAYAVTTEAGGTVSVTVNRVGDPAADNRQLRAAGNRVVIMLPSAEEDCPVADRGTPLTLKLRDAVALIHSDQPTRYASGRDYIPADAVLVLKPVPPAAFLVSKPPRSCRLSHPPTPRSTARVPGRRFRCV